MSDCAETTAKTATLTDDQWKAIEQELSGAFGSVKLLCDGFIIDAQVQREKSLKYTIAVYVNGWMRGEWYKGEAEEPKRFWRPKTAYLYKAKARSEAKIQLAKKRLSPDMKEIYRNISESSSTYWIPNWSSAKEFCRHLRATCKSIERIENSGVTL